MSDPVQRELFGRIDAETQGKTEKMTEETLGLDRRRPEKTMNLPQRKVSWGRS
jgi:hypothetical protein